jgi:hypothetical protein
MSAQPESKLSRAIIAMIKVGGGYAVKFHGGPMTEAGTPDILACIPIEVPPTTMEDSPLNVPDIKGLFVGIETKTPDNRREDKDGSPIQKRRAAHIRHAGGVVIIPCRSVSEARTALERLGWIRQPAFSTLLESGDN